MINYKFILLFFDKQKCPSYNVPYIAMKLKKILDLTEEELKLAFILTP